MNIHTDTPPIKSWSHSRLKDFESCKYKAYLKYVEKRPEPDTIDKTAANRGSQLHEEAEHFIRGELPVITPGLAKWTDTFERLRASFPDGKILVEDEWAFDLDWGITSWLSDNVWCRQKLDVFEFTSEITGEVTDWKSGKKFGNEVSHTQQGQQYAVGTFLRYPQLIEVTVSFKYLDHKGQHLTRTYSRSTLPTLLQGINRRALAMTTATDFPANPNKIQCRFCPYGPNNGGDSSCPVGVPI